MTESKNGSHNQPDEPTPDVPTPEPPRHDPGGLDLARGIADAYRDTAARRPQQKPRRPARRIEPKPAGDKDPTPLSSLVNKMIDENGWQGDLAAHRVIGDWGRIVGPEVAQHCEVGNFTDGQIDVQADSTAWATQLRMLAPRIVAKINDELGDGAVIRLNISGPQGPSWKSGRRSIRGARGPRDTYG